MSLFSSIGVSLSGLQAVSAQLQIASSNISNSGTTGYTRKTAVITTASLGTDGSGGVQVSGFSRATDATLFTTLTKATSESSLRSTQDDYLQQVQTLLGTADSDNPNLLQDVTDFTNAWSALEAEPESLVAQTNVVQTGQNLTSEVQSISEDVESLNRQCQTDIQSTVSDLNSYLTQISDLNIKIAQAQNSNQSSGDLEDERDQLVLDVAGITGVTVLQRSQGQIALYTSSGYQLVDSGSARTLTFDGTDVTSESNPGLSLNNALGGGKLEALIDFCADSSPADPSSDSATNVIQKLRDQLDSIVSAFTSLTTTATDGTSSFATAYTGNASATIKNGLTFTAIGAGTDSNDITVTFDNDPDPLHAGAYTATITDASTGVSETYDNLTNTGAGTNDVWSNLATAIANRPSTLVTTSASGTENLDPTTMTLPSSVTLSGGAEPFFTGTNRTDFSVNASLVDGTASLNTSTVGETTSALLDSTRRFVDSSSGLKLTGCSYSTLVSGILTGFQQAANNISNLSDTATSTQEYLSTKLTNETSVNVDTEMVNLVTLQNTYAASAHCISVINELMQTLQNIL